VAGTIIFLVVLLVALPVGFLVGGLVVSAVLGWLFTDRAEATHEGSELIDLNT
jgi:hypothetical protein